MNLRAWFLLPARVTAVLLIAGPIAIILIYSFLTRGDYGGVEKPWTLENYQRLADPLYLRILWRSIWLSAAATTICALLGFPLEIGRAHV